MESVGLKAEGIGSIPVATVSTATTSDVDRTIAISSSDPTLTSGLPASVTIPAGSSTAIVGVNGAGKSTLVSLLLRLMSERIRPASGGAQTR